jgi:hypothetical protein
VVGTRKAYLTRTLRQRPPTSLEAAPAACLRLLRRASSSKVLSANEFRELKTPTAAGTHLIWAGERIWAGDS